MAALDKVKILVLGDSGVGKTSLTHLIAHNEAIASPGWTVGCSVEVKLHEFREGYPQQRSVFVELWDVGGSSSHRNTRCIFYTPVHGVLLVHDLTNSKSQRNLNKWLTEVLAHESGGGKAPSDLDPEMMLGSSQLPMLVVGTKLDVAGFRNGRPGRGLTFAEEVGADELTLDCRSPRSLAAGSSAAVKLSRFFDRVIEGKFPVKDPANLRRTPYSSPYSSFRHVSS